MDTEKSAKQQLSDKISSSNNILITVSRDPSVDALAAAIALTLALDKLDKHTTAVFSGNIPTSINFLEPEKTFENNADALRDFVISLSKDKADRLRFKPDGDMVRIYITPYKTKLSADDLSFSDGEFNVELVIAIGVNSRGDLDDAIANHGRVLHSASTATIGLGDEKDQLGTISWRDNKAGSYSELVDSLLTGLSADKDFIDAQIATALLTGLVSATDQFRNTKTSAAIMTIAANLMAKGANQQLISSELSGRETGKLDANVPAGETAPVRDGLVISHELDDSEKWNTIKDEDQQVNERNAALANEQSQQALARTQDSLQQITPVPVPVPVPMPVPAPTSVNQASTSIPSAPVQPPQQVIATASNSTPQSPAPADTQLGPVAGSAELAELLAKNAATNASSSFQGADDDATLSHGEPYINESVSPLNATLLNEDAEAASLGSTLNGDNHITVSPAMSNQTPSTPYDNLPLPPMPSPSEPSNVAPNIATTPETAFTPLSPVPSESTANPINETGLPPVPPLNQNPISTDISSLTQSAAQLAKSTAPVAPVFPTAPAPAPMISPPAPTASDPGQFHIPGA